MSCSSNKEIKLIDNTNGTWELFETTMQKLYEVLNELLKSEKRFHIRINYEKTMQLISWLPLINSIVIENRGNRRYIEIRFDRYDLLIEDSGLEGFIIEMMETGIFEERTNDSET